MANPAFDAAMLLRGLRAMDAALGESYDVASHTCIPSPVVYSSVFPDAGIDFSKYQGIEGLKGTWRSWMYEDGGTGKLKTAVHPDVEETAVEAFGILTRCDKTKEGLVTKAEWEACQRGRSADDQLWDLEFLTALHNVTGKLATLEKNQPLNPANPDTYPELIQARADAKKSIAVKDAQISEMNVTVSALEAHVARVEKDAALYQKLAFGGLGGLGLAALYLGVRWLSRGRGDGGGGPANKPPRPQPHVEAAIARDQVEDPGIPKPRLVSDQLAAAASRPDADRPNPPARPAAPPDDIADALKEIDHAKSPVDSVRPSASLLSGVTPENVVISGSTAEPVAGVDSHVIRAQITLTYRHFLSQAAREALLQGRDLPPDADLVHSNFAEKVNEMVDKVMAEYHRASPEALADMWRTQLDDRGYITRRGVPQRLLMSVCGEFISRDGARAQSPFAGGSGAEIRSEGERRSGETDFMTRGLREWMRHFGRK